MIFDEIPFELKEYIFTYVTPNEWINTGKVSNEWMDLTLRSIKKVESCHALILDHLAEFFNQERNTNYTWVSLLTLMPRLAHLECIENTEALWTEISPICDHLKVLDCTQKDVGSFGWSKLDITFMNLVELRWDGSHEGPAFLLRIFQLAPKLEKIALKRFKINAEWKLKIPKSVKHILLKDVQFVDEQQCSMTNLCEDTSTLETFSVFCEPSHAIQNLYSHAIPKFFESPRLTKLALDHPNASIILENAFTKCPNLEIVCIGGDDIRVTDSWRKRIPASVKSFKAWGILVADNVLRDFSFDWLFQNYGALQSLEVNFLYCWGVNPEKFYPPKNLKKLYLGNYWPIRFLIQDVDPFSDICYRMIGGSHLVDVELHGIGIYESWRHIFPPTIKRLKLVDFCLSNEAKEVFSPQFICENPSNLEVLSLDYSAGDLPAMDLNAFSGMNKLQELYLINSGVSGEFLQSILMHCSALTNLFIRRLIPGALTDISDNLVLPSLLKLKVKKAVDEPSSLLKHFPKMQKVDIAIVTSEECWFEVMNCLQGVETAKISVKEPSFDLLWSLIGNINDTKFKYFCLAVKDALNRKFTFYLTNSLLDACKDFHHFKSARRVLWMKNYPTSPLLRKRISWIPSSMEELLQRYNNMPLEDDSDDDENDE